MELLDTLQKWICRTIGPSLAASLEPLAHRQNIVSLSVFYMYYFHRCSSELAQRSSDGLHDFSVIIPKCYKDAYVNSFFANTSRLWNSLPIEYFPLIYDLNGFKPKINRKLLSVRSFLTDATIFLCFFFLNSMPYNGSLVLHRVNPNLKKNEWQPNGTKLTTFQFWHTYC